MIEQNPMSLVRSQSAPLSTTLYDPASSFGPVEAAPPPAAGSYRLWRAIRRRGIIAVLIALPIAAAAGAAAWHLKPENFSTTSVLRMLPQDKTMLFKTADEQNREAFADYKRTQRQLVRSTNVLLHALRNEELSAIPAIQAAPDPVAWLEQHLAVGFPDDAQIMTVTLNADNPTGLDVAVNQIVKSYLEAFVDKDYEQKATRLNTLELTHAKFVDRLRSRRSELNQLIERLGDTASDKVPLEQQNAIRRYTSLQQQLQKVQLDIMQVELTEKIRGDGADQPDDLIEDEFQQFASADPEMQRLRAEQQEFQGYLKQFESRVVGKTAATQKPEHELKLQTFQRHIAAREEVLRQKFERIKDRMAATSQAQRDQQLELLRAQEQQLEQVLNEMQGDIRLPEKLPSTDLEMLRVDVAVLEDVLKEIMGEIERTKVELQPKSSDDAQNSSRVTVISPAYPARKSSRDSKLKSAAAAGTAGLLIPMLLLIWLASKNDRIYTRDEVSRCAGLPVIAAVPLVPRNVIRRFSDPRVKSHALWRARLTESVDLLAATLQRRASMQSLRVVMVSSSVAGEGKTTLAANLGASLAAAGYRVALVDFDLRRPALHRVFGVPLEPGVCDVLQHPEELATALRPTRIPNLFFLPAGRSGSHGLARLTSEELRSFFATLRQDYDFVVVDGSPILAVVDTCLVAQHVDGVVFSVFSDVSRISQVRTAAGQMEDFGITVAGAVVIGSKQEGYGDYYDHKYLTAQTAS